VQVHLRHAWTRGELTNSLRNLGRGLGRHLYPRWNRRLEDAGGFEEYVEQGLRFLETIYNAMGLGRLKTSMEDYVNYIVEIDDNWECVIMLEANLSKKPSITIWNTGGLPQRDAG